MKTATPGIRIPKEEIRIVAIRSSGPGGQKVNKASTAVQLRFNVLGSPSLPERVRRRLAVLAGRRLTSDGDIVIDARRFRTREANRRDALDRLAVLLRRAEQRTKPRRATVPTAASKRARVEAKLRRGRLKRLRGSVPEL